MSGEVHIGTASWTDPEFISAGWYPDDVKNDAEGRLRYYASRFPMVEVNATFYALPRRTTVEGWAERTPDDFRFHVKANQVISGHTSDPARLPAPLRALPYEADRQGRIRRPSRELRDAVIDAFVEVLAPLRPKMGAVLLQLPPHVVSGADQRAEIARIIERLKPLRTAVEFRHVSWADEAEREAAADMLGEREAAWVCVDAPRIDAASAMPPIVEVTCPDLAYLRLHGRNGDTWQGSRTVAERFDWQYSDDELAEWVGPVTDMSERAHEVAVVFNNNHGDFALRSAARFGDLLAERRR
ncbi:MAG: DUF72 domain-containing protein [Thermoleophilia bacterium]|nr:DUF72 domain-containing protein [Thermoleophilia bacterium]